MPQDHIDYVKLCMPEKSIGRLVLTSNSVVHFVISHNRCARKALIHTQIHSTYHTRAKHLFRITLATIFFSFFPYLSLTLHVPVPDINPSSEVVAALVVTLHHIWTNMYDTRYISQHEPVHPSTSREPRPRLPYSPPRARAQNCLTPSPHRSFLH